METSRRPVIVILCPPDGARPTGMHLVEAHADLIYTDAAGLSEALRGADALLLWDFFSEAVRDAWPSAGSLRWIHVAAAGVDKLLFPELVASDVVITNARGIFDRAIAEFVLGSILAVAKDLHGSHDLQAAKTWRRRETRMVRGATVLVVGTGSIGRETARVLRAVGMDVRGAGRTARSGDPDFGEVVASAEVAAHVGWADHVVVAAPLTAETRGLISAEVLAAMKPGSHLVNIGRGPIVDENALVDALRDGPVESASLDVFEVEPLPTHSPLWTMPGVAVSAHMSGDYEGWREALARQFVDNARRWFAAEPLLNMIDKQHGFVVSEESAGVGRVR